MPEAWNENEAARQVLLLSKYHGCGNDFLIVSDRELQGKGPIDPAALAVEACDRHTGIGADGFILVKTDPLQMVFYNADGSAAPMCGNGIRCFARFCLDHRLAGDGMEIQTGAGRKTVHILSRKPFLARVEMGRPDYDPAKIHADGPVWGREVEAAGRTVKLYSFFMSTVHTVWFVDDASDDSLLPVAEAIHRHPIFAEKSNVNLVQRIDGGTIKMRTWERGVGPTLACGTGACAALLTACKLGLCNPEADILLPRGRLHISIGPEEQVEMTGPAELIAEVHYPWKPRN